MAQLRQEMDKTYLGLLANKDNALDRLMQHQPARIRVANLSTVIPENFTTLQFLPQSDSRIFKKYCRERNWRTKLTI